MAGLNIDMGGGGFSTAPPAPPPDNPDGQQQDLVDNPPLWTYAPKGTTKTRQMAEFDALTSNAYDALTKGSGLDRATSIEAFQLRGTRQQDTQAADARRTAIHDAVAAQLAPQEPAPAPDAPPPDGGGGSTPVLGGLGNAFSGLGHVARAVVNKVPQGVRDVAGAELKGVSEMASSGLRWPLNNLAIMPGYDTFDASGNPTTGAGDIVRSAVEASAGRKGVAAFDIADRLASPATVGSVVTGTAVVPMVASGITGVAAREAVRAAGGSEGQQQLADVAGATAPFVPGIVRAVTDAVARARPGGRIAETPPAGELGAAALPDAAAGTTQPTARIPGLPGPIRATVNGPAEVGTRTGNLLQPRGLEQLGSDATVKDVIGVANDLRRQVGSSIVSLMAEARNADNVLGPTVQDAQGNIFLRDVIKPDGAPALKQDVIENPGRYPLTPEQAAAVQKLRSVAATARAEVNMFGVKTRVTTLEEGQGYFPRQPIENTTGADLTQTGRGTGGQKLRGFSEKSRVYTDPLEATNAGVVYADPIDALGRYVGENLKGASDAHIADMLKTFGETPADRRNVGLMQQVKRLRAQISGATDTAGNQAGRGVSQASEAARAQGVAERLRTLSGNAAERVQTATDARTGAPEIVSSTGAPNAEMLSAKPPTIDDTGGVIKAAERELRVLENQARQAVGRAEAAGNRSQATADAHTATLDRIDSLHNELDAIKGDYQDMLRNTTAVPPGRLRVSAEAAPALQGTDFTKADATRISHYYNNGILPDNAIGNTLRVIKGFNQKVIPMQAIGDASSLLRQLAVVLPSHPIAFLRNAGRSFYDAYFPSGWKGYQEWLAGPDARAAARSGVELMGEGGSANTDFWAQWIEKVPGLKNTQRQFEASSNRMRVDIWKMDSDMLRRTGQPVDAATLEQVGRNANRITGVSNVRATDVETLGEFAANYMRSRLETLTKAVSDGGIEGQLARQYLKNYVSTGLMVVTAAAIKQGRPLKEVLNPVTVNKDGRFHMNPNFGTVRVFGTDLNVFGSYSDLASLSMVVADGAYGAIKQKDAMQLASAIVRAGRAKASPAFSTPIDVGSGTDYVGNSARSWEYLLTRPVPIVGSQTLQSIQKGQSPEQVAFGTGANLLGARANPMTVTEQLGESARGMGLNSDFNALTPSERQKVLDANPALAKQRSDATIQRGGVTGQYEQAKVALTTEQGASDTALAAGTLIRPQWVSQYHDRQQQLVGARLIAYPDMNTKPQNAADRYYQQINAAKQPDGTIDWNAVDQWVAKQPAPDQAYIDRETGLGGTPAVREYVDTRKALDGAGYYDLRDKAWAALKEAHPAELGNLGTYDDWHKAEQADLTKQMVALGVPQQTAGLEAANKLSSYGTVKAFDTAYRTEFRHQFVVDHKDLALRAVDMGLFTPDAAERQFLRTTP